MDEEFLLSTKDNPYNPFTQWNEWYSFDEHQGYHTSGLLARIIVTSSDLSEADQRLADAEAVDSIIENINSDFYVKVTRPVEVAP